MDCLLGYWNCKFCPQLRVIFFSRHLGSFCYKITRKNGVCRYQPETCAFSWLLLVILEYETNKNMMTTEDKTLQLNKENINGGLIGATENLVFSSLRIRS